jgi:hypothetical protein
MLGALTFRRPIMVDENDLPYDIFTVNFVRLAGLDKHKARECDLIVRHILEERAKKLENLPPWERN